MKEHNAAKAAEPKLPEFAPVCVAIDKTGQPQFVVNSAGPKTLGQGWALTDGEERRRLDPEFPLPHDVIRRGLAINHFVKVGLEGAAGQQEHFWVWLSSRRNQAGVCVYVGQVCNVLRFSIGHGIYAGDKVEFGKQHVLEDLPRGQRLDFNNR